MIVVRLSLCACLAALGCGSAVAERDHAVAPAERAAPVPAARQQGFEIVRTLEHDPQAFTQGLAYHDGFLYEGTGRRGASSLRKIDISTGRVVRQADLPPTLFGEGIAILDGRVFQLTWLAGVGIEWDLETFRPLRQFRQVTEGWGLTHDGASLIQSDGSSRLYFLDPESLQLQRDVEVRDNGRLIDQINELEYVDGQVYANVWHSDDIVRIDPRSGALLGRIDLSGLMATERPADPEAVLNGIAYDPATGRAWVTGKLWPKLFEIRFVDRP